MKAHPLTIGEIDCTVLQDAEFSKTSEKLAERYPTVSPAEIEAALDGAEALDSINCLLINSGGTRILADVGFGGGWEATKGSLHSALNGIGVGLADIDIVYLTHFHGDHVAGLVVEEGRLEFSNARFMTTAAEWDEWMGRWAASDSPQDRKNLELFSSLQDRFTFVASGDEIAPGVSVVDLAGHTLGHTGLLVKSAGERLLHVVDLLHQAFQLQHLDWPFVFDSDPDLAAETRRRTLQRCADEGILTLFYHLPFPGLGTVARDGAGYAFMPVS
ncbi:MAG: MBL fold metallo-hydrolase [Chloroflexi bacterium]|nr:MBL fold metallo-hydrolase [Chloroflexota bacterium]